MPAVPSTQHYLGTPSLYNIKKEKDILRLLMKNCHCL